MFTGIIEEIGRVERMRQTGESIVMAIGAKQILTDMKVGDSISVNGVCLTVTDFSDRTFSVDVMPETFRGTSLKILKKGAPVNLERAMGAGGRFGGHFVSGHVDGTGTIIQKKQVDNAVYYEIEAASSLLRYVIHKGSIAVDGTSLTVFHVSERSFTISLIPHTLSETVLGLKGIGDPVNLESDMIGKYVEHFLAGRIQQKEQTNKSALSVAFLQENGFM